MIISNSRKFIFVHLHKTAGEAITSAMDQLLAWNDVVLGGTDFGEAVNAAYDRRFGLHKHSDAARIRAVVGEAVWSSYFTFAVVRHPVDRMASLHRYMATLEREKGRTLRQRLRRTLARGPVKPWSWPAMKAYRETADFGGFIRDPRTMRDPAALPQVGQLAGPDGAPMVDFVARFETLATDFAAICARIGVETPPLPRRNVSHRPAPAPMAPEDRAWLERAYAADIEAFYGDGRMGGAA